MTLRPGYVFCVAPRFHSRLAWTDRLQINGGVDRVADCFYPRGDWRSPSAEELALLLESPAATGWDAETILPPTYAALLTIPPHLRAAWWAVAEGLRPASVRCDRSPPSGSLRTGLGRYAVPSQVADSGAAGSQSQTGHEGYDDFVVGLIEFLRFKRLPLPERCQFDVVASRPGQLSTRVDPTTGTLAGLGFSVQHAAGAPAALRLVATINLEDEATHMVLLNLPAAAMAAMLAVDWSDAADARAAAAFCAHFLATLPEYPLVRVRLDPGDGLWLPNSAVVCDGYTREKRDIDISLSIQTAA